VEIQQKKNFSSFLVKNPINSVKANSGLKLLEINKNMIDIKKEIKRFLRISRKFEEFKRF